MVDNTISRIKEEDLEATLKEIEHLDFYEACLYLERLNALETGIKNTLDEEEKEKGKS